MICKQCKVDVPKVFMGKVRTRPTKSGTRNIKAYFDANGKEWHGNLCPGCYNAPKAPKESAVCKDCNQEKVRKFTGKITQQKYKTRVQNRREYGDGQGGIWHFLTCPECRTGIRTIPKRADKKKCPCGVVLPVTRYFKCEECQPDLGEDMGFAIYA
jgi:hypothetical protein